MDFAVWRDKRKVNGRETRPTRNSTIVKEGSGTGVNDAPFPVTVPWKRTPSRKESLAVIEIDSVFRRALKSVLGALTGVSEPEAPAPKRPSVLPFSVMIPKSSTAQPPPSEAPVVFKK